jgi:signal transduction histidine kinase
VNPQKSTLVRAFGWLDRRSPKEVCVAGALLIALIGTVSYATGPALSFSLFYLIPVLLVTRVTGFRPGALAALAAATMWLVADLNGNIQYPLAFTPYWNALMRLGTFLVAVSLVSAMRTLNAQLEERVIERTAALESQIIENRHLEKTILEISDLEQERIGQDLHDGLCQHLVVAAFTANMLQQNLATQSSPETSAANRIAAIIDDAITQARNLARGLYPVRLETEGLEMALHELASTLGRRFEVTCSVQCPSPVTVNVPGASIHLYRIAQEAVTNAAKHSGAGQIILSLSSDDDHLTMTIQDDGAGIGHTTGNPDGMGLRIMDYRARLIGAVLAVTRRPEGDTQVICEMMG